MLVRLARRYLWYILAIVTSFAAVLLFTLLYSSLMSKCGSFNAVQIQSGDKTLAAYVGYPDNAPLCPRPGVAIFHGLLASKEWMIHYARKLTAAGFVTVTVDQAGHGASTSILDTESLREGGINTLRYLQNLTCVDATHVGVLGWSMGGGAVLRIGEYFGHQEGLLATVIVGANTIPISTGNNTFYPNKTAPPNLLVAIGKNDELISYKDSKVQLADMMGMDASDIIENADYGNNFDFSLRRFVVGTSDHVFEVADPELIDESVKWMQRMLYSNATVTPEMCETPNVIGMEFLSVLCGLSWISALMCVLSLVLTRKDVVSYEYLFASDTKTQSVLSYIWWLLLGLIWGLSFVLGLVFAFIPVPVAYLMQLIGMALFAILFFVTFHYMVRKHANFGFLDALKDPWKYETSPYMSLGVFGACLVWLATLQLIFFNVPWHFSLGSVFLGSLEQIRGAFYRRFLLLIGCWVPLFFAFTYELAIIKYYIKDMQVSGSKRYDSRSTKIKKYCGNMGKVLLARIWLVGIILLFQYVSVFIFQARIFGNFSFVALFLYPMAGLYTMLSLLTVPVLTYFKFSVVDVAIISSFLLSYYISSTLAFKQSDV